MRLREAGARNDVGMSYGILTRSILDGYFNPLVFWYKWEATRPKPSRGVCCCCAAGRATNWAMDSNLQELRPKVVDSVKTTCYLDVFSCKHAFSVKKVPQERVQLESPASVTVHHSIVDANASYMRSHDPLTWTGCTCSVKTRMSWVIWTALACQVAFAHERHLALLVSGAGKRESQVDYQLSAALCVFKALTWLYSLPPETTALGCQWT